MYNMLYKNVFYMKSSSSFQQLLMIIFIYNKNNFEMQESYTSKETECKFYHVSYKIDIENFPSHGQAKLRF